MSALATCVLAILVALSVDRWAGEPRASWHPVVWMGRYLDRCASWVAPATDAPHKPSWVWFWRGTFCWCVGAAAVGVFAVGLEGLVKSVGNAGLAALGLGLALKPMMAWAMLRTEVLAVESALTQSLVDGRQRLSWLVSRDVNQLSEVEVRESAIESLAENFNDSVIAPLFWFVLLGLPGAALYRFANTADAMWGYRGARNGRLWEWGGKWAAHADDVLSWVPARITAILLMWVGVGRGARHLVNEAQKTPSPNSGWPMAAMALVLDVRLGKPREYVLNAHARCAEPSDTLKAVNVCSNALLVTVFIGFIAIIFDYSLGALG